MADTLHDIKRRIGTTAQIRKVTGTLQKVSSARLAQLTTNMEASSAYLDTITAMLKLAMVSRGPNAPKHTLEKSTAPTRSKRYLVVLGSDRGLCGSFNTLIMKKLRDILDHTPPNTYRILFHGHVLYNRALRLEIPEFDIINSQQPIIEQLTIPFLQGQTSRVELLFWQFQNRIHQTLEHKTLLPFSPDQPVLRPKHPSPLSMDLLVHPSPAALMDSLMENVIETTLSNTILHTAATEHTYRQQSMARAADNAGDMLNDLKRHYSRCRQESITTEMLEIVAGMNR